MYPPTSVDSPAHVGNDVGALEAQCGVLRRRNIRRGNAGQPLGVRRGDAGGIVQTLRRLKGGQPNNSGFSPALEYVAATCPWFRLNARKDTLVVSPAVNAASAVSSWKNT